MGKVEVPGLGEVDFNKLDSTPPTGSKVRSSLTAEIVVDPTPQPLRVLRPFARSCLQIPSLLKEEAQIVLQALFSCFEKQEAVKEGLVGDLIWGFCQCQIPVRLTVVGLQELERQGYVKFQAPDNTFVDLTTDQAAKAWVRYQPKLLEMIYEDSAS
jgi:hypothetical protein